MNKLTKMGLIGLTIAGLSSSVAMALGPLIEGVMISNFYGHFRMNVSDPISGGGLTPNLAPEDWMKYRVKVIHADSTQDYFVSDSFDPTSNNIQLCMQGGCEAPPIDLGTEDLDWDNPDLRTFHLEAKSCLLCSWVAFEIEER